LAEWGSYYSSIRWRNAATSEAMKPVSRARDYTLSEIEFKEMEFAEPEA